MNKNIKKDILDILLDGKKHTEKEISNKLNVSISTVYYQIKEMKKHYPIKSTKGKNTRGGIYIDNTYFNLITNFTEKEKEVIKIGLSLYLSINLSLVSMAVISQICSKLDSKGIY